jgi:polyisoprenoid-binding protein YceI
MFIQNKIIRMSTVILSLFLFIAPASAGNADLCTPFKDTKIDQSMIESMLKAAEDGYLYQINDNSSKMGFCVESSIGVVKGNFKNFKGGIALKGNEAKTLVSIDVDSLETNRGFIKSILKGDNFFNVDVFPELIFVSSSFEWMTETRGVLKGELTMHGITKPVAFYVEITEVDGDLGDSNTILVKATTTVQRSEFDMFALSSMVSNKVNLCMSVEAKRYIAL